MHVYTCMVDVTPLVATALALRSPPSQFLTRIQLVRERRWKHIAGDVFRPPPAPRTLAVCFGSGAHILAAAAALLLLTAAGACPPDSLRRSGLTLLICFAPIGGFAAVGLLRSTQRSAAGWQGVCVKTATYFPGARIPRTTLQLPDQPRIRIRTCLLTSLTEPFSTGPIESAASHLLARQHSCPRCI